MRIVPMIAAAGLLATAGCGGTRQDADEPSGEFRLSVAAASFPAAQTMAESARLRIDVRNDDQRTLPNVAVTVETKPDGSGAAPAAFAVADRNAELADTSKPVWIVDSGPKGGTTAYTNTWALGRLAPNRTTTFEWKLTAVRAGTYTINYRVSPGLDGKAKPAAGGPVTGSFKVTISDAPVPARVDDRGKVVRGKKAGSGSL
jgi:hypothetical protein